MTLERIADAVGVCQASVSLALKLHGVPLKTTAHRKQQWGEGAEQRYIAGETPAAIARSLGLSRERVRQVLVKRGVPTLTHRCDEVCAALLAPDFRTRNEVARRLNVNPSTVKTRAEYHGVVTRMLGRPPGRRPRHYCDERCERVNANLEAGMSTGKAVLAAGFKDAGGRAANLKRYHPGWGWRVKPRKEAVS